MNEVSIRTCLKVAKKIRSKNKRKQQKIQQNTITKYFKHLAFEISPIEIVPDQPADTNNTSNLQDKSIITTSFTKTPITVRDKKYLYN